MKKVYKILKDSGWSSWYGKLYFPNGYNDDISYPISTFAMRPYHTPYQNWNLCALPMDLGSPVLFRPKERGRSESSTIQVPWDHQCCDEASLVTERPHGTAPWHQIYKWIHSSYRQIQLPAEWNQENDPSQGSMRQKNQFPSQNLLN